MTTDLETIAMLRDSMQRYSADHYDFLQRGKRLELPGGFDPAIWQTYAEQGWLSLRLPEELGGLEADAVAVGAVMEATFLVNPKRESGFRFRATHLDGKRAPKVVRKRVIISSLLSCGLSETPFGPRAASVSISRCTSSGSARIWRYFSRTDLLNPRATHAAGYDVYRPVATPSSAFSASFNASCAEHSGARSLFT